MRSSTQDLRLGADGERSAIEAISPLADSESLDAGAGVDRADWPPQVVLSPNDVVTTLRRSARMHRRTGASARQRGDWPTAVSAVTLDLKDTGPLSEGVPAPVNAIFDILLAPFRSHDLSVTPYQRERTNHVEKIPNPDTAAPTSEDQP